MQNEPLLIKKYDNRRLYLVSEKKYISLEDVRKLIVEGNEIRVIENRSGKDITKHVLLQVLMDMSPEKLETFPLVYLKFLIQSPASLLKDYFGNFFEQQMSLFLGSREQYLSYLNEASRTMMGVVPGFGNPFMQMMQNNPFFGSPSGSQEQKTEHTPEPDPPDESSEQQDSKADPSADSNDLDEMKRMLAFMAKKIEDLENKS